MNDGFGPAVIGGPYGNPYWMYGPPFPAYGYPSWGSGPWYGTFPAAMPTAIATGAARTDDAHIREFVERAIDNDPSIPAHAEIDVAVENGVVTLTGTVSNKRIKHAAGDDAWFVPQVFDVHNEIAVVSHREHAG
ncbi:MAG: BON domain-containing protein [Chloroflexota bacterium]